MRQKSVRQQYNVDNKKATAKQARLEIALRSENIYSL